MDRARAWLRRLPVADRVAIALGLLLLVLLAISDEGEPDTLGSPHAGGAVALLAASVLVLTLRKRFPGTVVLVMIGVTTVWYLVGYTNDAITVPTLVAFYQLGITGDRRRQFGVGGIALAVTAVSILGFSGGPVSMAFNAIGYLLAAILFGEVVRSRRELLAQYAEKAAQAEANLDTEAERRVAEERLRVARDVHDVLAHAISVMTVQAGVGEDALDRDPAAVKDALATIRSSGKDAMAEMRATVAVLRRSERAESTPAPGLEQVAELVEGARAQGLDVELTTDLGSDRPDVPDGTDLHLDRGIENVVQLAAYRVVQESLTNVIRHADASRAVVRLGRRPAELTVAVVDDGARPRAPRSPGDPGPDPDPGPGGAGGHAGSLQPLHPTTVGFGLRGMRERVESLGGNLRFGWRPAGGWEVVASLPIRTEAP